MPVNPESQMKRPAHHAAMAEQTSGAKLAIASTPSRDSQLDRHCDSARQARCGLPRCSVEDISPPEISASASR